MSGGRSAPSAQAAQVQETGIPMAVGEELECMRTEIVSAGLALDHEAAIDLLTFSLAAQLVGRGLQVFEDPVEHPVLGPTIHTGVDRVPVPKALRQPSPLAPLLGDVQDRVEHLQIGHADIATLSREAGLDACVLRLAPSSQRYHEPPNSVNRP